MNRVGPELWQKVSMSREKILCLDYDGTLAPFHVERKFAKPLPGICETLFSILEEGLTHVSVVSGRPLSELKELLGSLSDDLFLFGSHGWEWMDDTGVIHTAKIDEDTSTLIEQAEAEAISEGEKEMAEEGNIRERVEKKIASVAVHTRGLNFPQAEAWLQRLRPIWTLIAKNEMEIIEFKGGLELKVKGRNKGDAVRKMINKYPSSELMIYVGDDATDEDAFRALPKNGLGIKVGGNKTSAADYFVDSCDEVLDFLRYWNKMEKAALENKRGEP